MKPKSFAGEKPGRARRAMQVITRLNVGGPALQVLNLAEGLSIQGYSSDLVFGTEGPGEGSTGTRGATSVYHLPALRRNVNPLYDLITAKQLHRLFKRRHPDVVHTHLAKAGALGRLSAFAAGVPVVVHTFHGHVLTGYFSSPVSRLLIEFERRLARNTSALIAVSDGIRDELLSYGIGHPSQWRTIPLGLDLEPFLANRYGKFEGRAALGLSQGVPIVAFVGRLAAIKDPLTFIKACEVVAKRKKDVEFVIAGDGPLRNSIEQRAVERLGDKVKLLGWVSDLEALYSAVDVVVLTSKNEGTPTTLIEAAASAIPVVATAVGGVRDVVKQDESGLLVEVQDHNGIATAVVDLLADEARARAMGQAGRRFVATRFSLVNHVAATAALYDELIGT